MVSSIRTLLTDFNARPKGSKMNGNLRIDKTIVSEPFEAVFYGSAQRIVQDLKDNIRDYKPRRITKSMLDENHEPCASLRNISQKCTRLKKKHPKYF